MNSKAFGASFLYWVDFEHKYSTKKSKSAYFLTLFPSYVSLNLVCIRKKARFWPTPPHKRAYVVYECYLAEVGSSWQEELVEVVELQNKIDFVENTYQH